jgi:hypothetical protein
MPPVDVSSRAPLTPVARRAHRRRDQERQKEKLRDGKERFSAMEASIKQRGEHVTRLEAIVRDEVPDD